MSAVLRVCPDIVCAGNALHMATVMPELSIGDDRHEGKSLTSADVTRPPTEADDNFVSDHITLGSGDFPGAGTSLRGSRERRPLVNGGI